jgi:hypothetical protein
MNHSWSVAAMPLTASSYFARFTKPVVTAAMAVLTCVAVLTQSGCASAPDGLFEDVILLYASETEARRFDEGVRGAVPVGEAFAVNLQVLPLPLPLRSAVGSAAGSPASSAAGAGVGLSLGSGSGSGSSAALPDAARPLLVRTHKGTEGWVPRSQAARLKGAAAAIVK